MNTLFKNIYPRQTWTNEQYYNNSVPINNQDERFGGFLLPFIAGAAVSAPLWLVAGSNKAQNNYYPYPVNQYPYYPNYPVYVNGYPNQSYVKYN